jgi:hypothetical protein
MMIFVTPQPQLLFRLFATEFPGTRVTYANTAPVPALEIRRAETLGMEVLIYPAMETPFDAHLEDAGAFFVGQDCDLDYTDLIQVVLCAMEAYSGK